jgi:Lon protease-like protein
VESPPGKSVGLRRVGCIGRVTKFEELDDGRLVIMLTGISRCKVTGEVPTDKPYRVCILDCEPYRRDFDKGAGEVTVDRPALVKAMKAYLDVRTLAALRSTIAETSTEELINMVALAAPHGPEEKQAILEAADLKARADILVALAEMDHAAGAGGRGSTLQ